ncbi:helix-turn-helix domain-containing protein [Flavobacteriaceae bacterium LMO-SS05]
MQGLIKIGALICAILLSNIVAANADPILSSYDLENTFLQHDSIRTNYLENALENYKEELKNKSADSIEVFKNIALICAELKRSEEALDYTEAYIKNSADISILNKDSFSKISDTEEFDLLIDKYFVNANVLIVIYFFIAFIGFFFAIIINLKRDSDRISNLLLGGFVVVHSLFILEFGIYASNIRYIYPHTYLMSSSVALLYGPLLYFYFKRISQQYKFKINDLLHLLPLVALLMALIPFYSLSAKEKLNIMFNISDHYSTDDFLYIVFIPKLSSLIIYGFFIGKLYFNKQFNLSLKNDDDLIKWKRNIYYIHVMYIFSYLLYGLSASHNIFAGSNFIYHSQIMAMSLMVLYVAQMAYINPKVFSYKKFALINGLGFSKYLNSGLTPSLSEELKEDLITLLTVDKVYRDSALNLETLSNKLNTTRHNTSQIINEHFDMNFFELINKFRIEEASNLLLEDTNGNLNIIDIAYEVGYNNKVTFNKAFKKSTSLTPTQFIDSIKNNGLVNR